MDVETITVMADVAAPPPRVWEAYTSADHITQWNFAHESWHCPTASVDLVSGGSYIARMEARDGSAGFDLRAVYSDIVPERTLDMTLEDGRRVQTTFEPCPAGTRVTTRFDPETQNSRDMQQSGWQAILDQFKSYAEGLS